MQTLRMIKCDSDSPLHENLKIKWKDFCSNLKDIQSISIPWWMGRKSSTLSEFHGFCDASQRAYATTANIPVIGQDGNVSVHLLVAKTRVAPVKVVSLPRLELCGAVLLTRLVIKFLLLFKWMLMLLFIRGRTPKLFLPGWWGWKCFVANRVSKVHQNLPSARWSHISRSESPSDLASRGLSAGALMESKLWWHEPCWLSEDKNQWPTHEELLHQDAIKEELKPV